MGIEIIEVWVCDSCRKRATERQEKQGWGYWEWKERAGVFSGLYCPKCLNNVQILAPDGHSGVGSYDRT